MTTADARLDLMTIATLATYFGVSEETIRRWHRTGYGPPGFRLVNRGSSPVVYRRADVLEWLDRQAATATPPLPPRPLRRR